MLVARITSALVLLATVAGIASPAYAQFIPNLDLNTDAAQDSVTSTEWDHVFPIWGREVIKRGYELPLPVGANLQWVSQYQDMTFGNLKLGFNNQGLNDVSDFIDIGKSTITSQMAQLRLDLWVLPFLNVYGLAGGGTNKVEVTVGKPLELKVVLDRDALLAGFGGNVSMAVQRYFVIVDANMSWADVEGVDDLTRATVLSARVGRSFRLRDQRRLAGWLGVMRLGLATETSGSIRLGDALPGLGDNLDDYQNEDWYQNLNPAQQQIIDDLVAELQARDPADTTIQYEIDKGLSSKWSLLLGGQFQFTPSWMLRAEYAQSEHRGSLLLNLNYRFGL